MKNLYFDDFEDFSCVIADTYDALDYDEEDVAIIAKYEEARQIIKELACIGYDLHSIDIDDEFDGYNAEYIITLYDNEIFCEPMLRENEYITDDSPVMYILDNCSSKVIPYCKGKTVYEVTVGIDEYNEEDECDCDECDDSEDDGFTVNGKPATKEEFDRYVSQFRHDEKPTTTSKESYFINGKSVDKSEFDKKYEEFEEKYMDNIRNMMLNYCEFMDEVNEWKRLLFGSVN